MHNYVKTNKLDDYQPEIGYKPNYEYILNTYSNILENEELLRFIKRFELKGFLCNYQTYRLFNFEKITYLLKNNAVCIEDIVTYLDKAARSVGGDKFISEWIPYFLNKDHEIKPQWVVKVIDDDELIERIKPKHTFTFKEVINSRQQTSFRDQDDRDKFSVQVRKHFSPEVKDPLADVQAE